MTFNSFNVLCVCVCMCMGVLFCVDMFMCKREHESFVHIM